MTQVDKIIAEYNKLQSQYECSVHIDCSEAVALQKKIKFNFNDIEELIQIYEALNNYEFYCNNSSIDLIDKRPLKLLAETEKAYCVEHFETKNRIWFPKSKLAKINYKNNGYFDFIIDLRFVRNNNIKV